MNATSQELQMLVRLKKCDEGNEFITFLENQYVIYLHNVLKMNGEDLIVAKGKALGLQEVLTLIKSSDQKLSKQSKVEAEDRT